MQLWSDYIRKIIQEWKNYQEVFTKIGGHILPSYFDWKPYNLFLSNYLRGSRTTITSQAIKLEAVQPFLFLSSYLVGSRTTFKNQAINWKPYNCFNSSYFVGSRTTINSQAIKLEAVQPFLFLSSYLVGRRTT